MILSINPKHPEPRKIAKAVQVLEQGGVIAYPTGTVIGFGCDLYNKKAIERVYQIKGMQTSKPLSFLCEDLSNISKYARVPDAAYRIMRRLIPGPYTFILEATKEVPRLVLHQRKQVGIRVPDHPVAQALLSAFGKPIISTSAGTNDEVLTDPAEIAERFKNIDLVLDGGVGGMMPSTVLSFDEDGNITVLREGAGILGDLLETAGKTA